MLIKQEKNMTEAERIAAENSNNQFLQELAYAAQNFPGELKPGTEVVFLGGSSEGSVNVESVTGNRIYVKGLFGYREDTLENWIDNNPVLEQGEPAVVRDGKEGEWLKVGDGVSAWRDLPYKKGPKGEKGDKGDSGPQGVSGVYVGSGEMLEGYNIQIDPNGDEYFEVEQTFDPTSGMPQSGKAVAEAVSGKADKEEWEQIADVTLTEDAAINVTTDMDGKPFALKKFQIDFITGVSEGSTESSSIWLHATKTTYNSYQPMAQTYAGLPKNKTAYGHFVGVLMGHWYSLNETSSASPEGYNYATTLPFGVRTESRDNAPITGLRLNYGYSGALPNGTNVKVWGVRA